MTIDEEIRQIRQWRDRQIDRISRIDNLTYQRILIIACIDAFVQHQNTIYDMKKNKERVFNWKAFSTFLQKYMNDEQCHRIMTLVCPTTLYYDYQKEFGTEELKLDVDSGRIYVADDKDATDESERLIKLLQENERNKARAKHQYSALIYQMRNKLVHEMSLIGCPVSFLTEDSDPIPHMVVLSEIENNKAIPYKWTLHIPMKLLWKCFKESTDNYLDECQRLQKHPLGDYDPNQKSTFAFYD